MPKKATMEKVLKDIYAAYPDAFGERQRLSGLFADLSGGQLKAQKNQLDIFLKCDGNTRILALRDESPQKQQREYRRLIREMADSYGMQQQIARQVCDVFWETALGTQAPDAEVPKEKKASFKLPFRKSPEKQPQKHWGRQMLALWAKMSGLGRVMFAVGAYGVIACTVRLVQVMIRNGFAAGWRVLYLLDGIYLLNIASLVFYMIPRELSRLEAKVLYFFAEGPSIFFWIWFVGMLLGMICPFPIFWNWKLRQRLDLRSWVLPPAGYTTLSGSSDFLKFQKRAAICGGSRQMLYESF